MWEQSVLAGTRVCWARCSNSAMRGTRVSWARCSNSAERGRPAWACYVAAGTLGHWEWSVHGSLNLPLAAAGAQHPRHGEVKRKGVRNGENSTQHYLP